MIKRSLLLTSLAVICLAASLPAEPSAPGGDRPRARGEFFQSLTPEQQERFLKLLDDWARLTVEQRREILGKFTESRNFSPAQREQLKRSLEHFEQMPPEQRDRIRDHMRKWKSMSPEDREKMRQRDQEMREKAERELKRMLDELGIQPAPEQMRWIRQFYFRKRLEIERQAGAKARELKSQLAADASDEDKLKVRQQVQTFRKELEEKAKPEVEAFARNPHPLPPPENSSGEKPHRKHAPRPQGDAPVAPPGSSL